MFLVDGCWVRGKTASLTSSKVSSTNWLQPSSLKDHDQTLLLILLNWSELLHFFFSWNHQKSIAFPMISDRREVNPFA